MAASSDFLTTLLTSSLLEVFPRQKRIQFGIETIVLRTAKAAQAWQCGDKIEGWVKSVEDKGGLLLRFAGVAAYGDHHNSQWSSH